MFGELPKLFERNFAIGFFLPVAVFMAINLALLPKLGLSSQLLAFINKDVLIGTTIIGLASWLCGVLLLVLNRDIYRFLEGYGKLNPARVFVHVERYYYQKIDEELSEADRERERLNKKLTKLNTDIESLRKELFRINIDSGFEGRQREIQEAIAEAEEQQKEVQKVIAENRGKRGKIIRKKAERFPDSERWLLPTAFGNTIRAFEVYSRVMYGLDAIPGWERLLAVIPKDYRTLIDDAKAQTDFWVNLWFLSLILVFEYISISTSTYQLNLFWFLPVAVLFAFIASNRARTAAIEWGHYVKASFDLFLPDLYRKLCFQYPLNRDEERQKLVRFSQAIIYRSESSVHDRALPKLKENNEG